MPQENSSFPARSSYFEKNESIVHTLKNNIQNFSRRELKMPQLRFSKYFICNFPAFDADNYQCKKGKG